MKTINHDQLAAILREVSHSTFLTINAMVDVKARRAVYVDSREVCPTQGWSKCPAELEMAELRENPWREVFKLSRVNVATGVNYEAAVNRRLAIEGKEPTFVAQERAWGERIAPALVIDKGKLYLVAHVQRANRPVYLGRKAEGAPLTIIPTESILHFLPPHRPATNQGTDKETLYRNWALTSIVGLSHAREHYRVRRFL